MTARSGALHAVNILILEDDYYLATDLQVALEAEGATVVGPFGDVEEARSAILERKPDCGVIDVNLGDGPSFEVPNALVSGNVPFAFVTGYDADTIPPAFGNVMRFEKPVSAHRVVEKAVALLAADNLSR